jgi:acyl carrier protein
MNNPETRLIDYIARQIIRRPTLHIDPTTKLVSSGLIDSLSLVQILAELEDVTHMRIPPGKVQAKDMDTVAQMLATAQRVGKPR